MGVLECVCVSDHPHLHTPTNTHTYFTHKRTRWCDTFLPFSTALFYCYFLLILFKPTEE